MSVDTKRQLYEFSTSNQIGENSSSIINPSISHSSSMRNSRQQSTASGISQNDSDPTHGGGVGKRRGMPVTTISLGNAPSKYDSQNGSLLHPPPSPTSHSAPDSGTLTPGRPRPPARSPLRQSQSTSSPRPTAAEPLAASSEESGGGETMTLKPQGDASDAAKARRREAYKSGMSFISLYELYSEGASTPVPPLPPFDPSTFASTSANTVKRARSGSTASTKEREAKTPLLERTSSSSSTAVGHRRNRSGSIGASPLRSVAVNGQPDGSNNVQAPKQTKQTRLGDATLSYSLSRPGSPSPLSSASTTTLVTPSIASTETAVPPSKTKRQHVLFELLETERAYSSDMALVRAVHLPLALGLKVDFGPMSSSIKPNTEQTAENGPSRSSGISTNTASSSQSQSGSSGYPTNIPEPPMTVEDAKVIFANVDELAEFTGRFTEFIQLGLGTEIDGGIGPDKIGNLFLEMLPIMVPLYETYITKHSASIARLTALMTENPTPAMLSYIEQTKAIASTHSNSWDLNSLLIKPIQRFLKYPLLLETLLSSTADDHPDKPDLVRAKGAMVDASRLVNEQTQKVEICRTILQRKPLKGLSAVFATNVPTSEHLKTKGSKSVFAVTKSKDSQTPKAITPSQSPAGSPFDAGFDPIKLENRLVAHASGGAGSLEETIKHLQGFETVIPAFVKDIVNWVRAVRETLLKLEKWAGSFERVIALDEANGIEALEAFRGVLADRLCPTLDNLETAVRTTLVPTLSKIQGTLKGPTLLLNTAASLRTVHNQLMNTPFTGKSSKPSPQLVEGSKTYLALMQQLRTDLPVYVRHLDRMFGFVTMQWAKWQERWYREVGCAWGDLWKALEVGPGSRKEYRAKRHREMASSKRKPPTRNQILRFEDEEQKGAYGCNGDETGAIWWERWEEINASINALGVPSGNALQGVKSLQNLLRSRQLPPAVAGVNYPLPAPEPIYSPPFDDRVIHEMEEPEDEDSRYMPPGYFPTSPSSINTQPKRTPSQSTYIPRGETPSAQPHAINSFLPAVSPGPSKKDKNKGSKIMKANSTGEDTRSRTSSQQTTSTGSVSREWGLGTFQGSRSKSRDREPIRKKSEPSDLNASTTVRSGDMRSSNDDVLIAGGPKSVPRGSSFRRRLSENLWFGDPTEKSTGLDIDLDELEAAIATTHAREEREAEIGSISQRLSTQSDPRSSLQRRNSSSSSMSLDTFRKRRTSAMNEPPPPRRIGSSQGRVRTINDNPRQILSEYGRSLAPTLDMIGPALLGHDAPILFTCSAVADFPRNNIEYAGLPFLTLRIGDVINIIKDAGRPSKHPQLVPVVRDGVDTLFMGKRVPDAGETGTSEVGWLWASFVIPIE